jgi:hypothetical protein
VVQDPTGAVVPSAAVVVVNERTGNRVAATTDGHGVFVFPSLPPGEYKLTIEALGFRKAVVTGLALNVASTAKEVVQLEVGQASETLTVEAKETAVAASDAQAGRVIAIREIEALPQLERNPLALGIFQPGAQIRGGDIGSSTINGARVGSNAVRIDGIDASDPVSPALAFAVPTNADAVQEFRVITHGGKAEYGRSAGVQIDLVTPRVRRDFPVPTACALRTSTIIFWDEWRAST